MIMAIVAIILSLFAIAVSLTTFIAVMALVVKRETNGESITTMFNKPEETPNAVPHDDTTELENFTPNFTKPVSVKFL